MVRPLIIYLVQDQKTKQIWALKHVHKREAKDARYLKQTELEYNIASKFDHPVMRKVEKLIKKRTLLNVTDLYLIMEYVDGVSIEQQKPRNLKHALGIFKAVAEGPRVHALQGICPRGHETQQRVRDR